MQDIAIRLDGPGALADAAEALGAAGVSIEGGGAWCDTAHFLVADAAAAQRALGRDVVARDVVTVRLDQARPGQLGALTRAMAEAGVAVEVLYSDHDHRLVLVVDDLAAARAVADAWAAPPQRTHAYGAGVRWTGNRGAGTARYDAYGRDHDLVGDGRPTVPGSSAPRYRGDADRWNPEQLVVAALAACHQLSYLHACADAGVVVTAYADDAEAHLLLESGGGARIVGATLRPRVTIDAASDPALALALHEPAARACFVARSVAFPVTHAPTVEVAR
ncbi:MAG: OsmC family protein [Myxococcota bacterium]